MKVIIVEDEFLAQQELSWLIKEHSQMEIVGTFDDGLDVLKFLQHNRVDLPICNFMNRALFTTRH